MTGRTSTKQQIEGDGDVGDRYTLLAGLLNEALALADALGADLAAIRISEAIDAADDTGAWNGAAWRQIPGSLNG